MSGPWVRFFAGLARQARHLRASLCDAIPPRGHHWRPARVGNGPARYCDICEHTEPLSDAEFYAYFGVMPPRFTAQGWL